jgi:hypothetical protein
MFVLPSALRSAVWRLFWGRKSQYHISPGSRDRQSLIRFTDRTIAHLLPMFLQMLKDDFPDVRLHIISKLEQVNKGMFLEKFSSP